VNEQPPGPEENPCLAGLGGLSEAAALPDTPFQSFPRHTPLGSLSGLTQAWHGCESFLSAAEPTN